MNLLRKIKGALGFCQTSECWQRATKEITWDFKKGKIVKRVLCNKHSNDFLKWSNIKSKDI